MNDYVVKQITCNGKKMLTKIDKEYEAVFDSSVWTAGDNGKGRVYVYRSVWNSKEKKPKKIYWHTFITNPPAGKVVDHINGDPLDNRRSNLRAVTWEQNNINRAAA